ncbi:MAG: hypothetical protein GTO03_05625, partial [Planctomycetales bacterium]|nr:hypothetical protein [Planctomycetales bacterium]
MIAISAPFHRVRRSAGRRRRGIAVVIVLGVISLALAISYAMLRTQTTTLVLQRNAGRRMAARQAAAAGLSAGLQKMHTNSWAGVGTVLNGQLSATDSYEVRFVAGDPTLTPADAAWLEYPYRVTLVSTGYSADPANPSLRASHRASAVVQLVRRQMSPVLAGFSDVQNHTLYQWQNEDVVVEMPFRAEGPVHLEGPLALYENYPYPSKPFDGAIDEVALFARALTASEIEEIYKAAKNPASSSFTSLAGA